MSKLTDERSKTDLRHICQFHAIVIFRLKSISDIDFGSLPKLYGKFMYAKLKTVAM